MNIAPWLWTAITVLFVGIALGRPFLAPKRAAVLGAIQGAMCGVVAIFEENWRSLFAFLAAMLLAESFAALRPNLIPRQIAALKLVPALVCAVIALGSGERLGLIFAVLALVLLAEAVIALRSGSRAPGKAGSN